MRRSQPYLGIQRFPSRSVELWGVFRMRISPADVRLVWFRLVFR